MSSASAAREKLWSLLGDLPLRHRPIGVEVIGREPWGESGVLDELVLDLNGLEPVPAYFVRPANGSRFPVVLYNHAHGGDYKLGKDELIDDSKYFQKPSYAEVLTARGGNALCIDHWVFGGRGGRTESSVFKQMLWQGRVMWGMMVFDSLRAIDYLVTRDDVDPGRIGTLGLSMGSTMAWWTAALDERVKVCVDICCLTEYHTLIAEKGLKGHGIYYYVPGLLKHFTASDVNALIAPRAHLGIAGLRDPLTPVRGLDIIEQELDLVYGYAQHPERWKLLRYDVAHQETPEGRQEALAFLRANL